MAAHGQHPAAVAAQPAHGKAGVIGAGGTAAAGGRGWCAVCYDGLSPEGYSVHVITESGTQGRHLAL